MFACIVIPDFPLQAALRHEPEWLARPVALIDESSSKSAVFQMTAAAQGAGVRAGIPSTQALARCPGLQFRLRSLPRERAATEILLQTAYAFSPSIESTANGVCTLDLRGLPVEREALDSNDASMAEQLHFGFSAPRICSQRMLRLQRWAEELRHQLALLHLPAQIGVAENPDLARLAAQMARPVLVVSKAREFVDRLPTEELRPSPATLGILRKWGIQTAGALVRLGRENLTERLGMEGGQLFDAALADTARPLNTVLPPEVFEESADFEEEIETLEPLLFLLRRFLEQIARRLELAQHVAEQIELSLRLVSGDRHERVFRIPAPTCNVDTLFRALFTHLETVRTDHAISGLHLRVRPCQPDHQQLQLFETPLRDPNHFYETLARLTALLGPERVGTPVVEQSHRPDAFRMEPVNCFAPAAPAGSRSRKSRETPKPSEPGEANGVLNLRLRRCRPPSRIEVQVEAGRPVSIRVERKLQRLSQARGPWRISGQWWDTETWERDEWDVETADHTLYRLFKSQESWFLDATYD
jgi:protein ImuB